ncbi:phosphotransferase [Actinomadura sp. 9N407]|uniref:phosphotransferase n=1 Tax=Actinomadura sp. 9N407 TaxID=3375154 RepID=UPI0037AB2AA5
MLFSAGLRGQVIGRDPIHVWELSAVERVRLDDGTSVILKTAAAPFTKEANMIRHVAKHGVPVPALLMSTKLLDGQLAMLLEDLGPMPEQDAPMDVGARTAVAVHSCPAPTGLPLLDARALASLPVKALTSLESLQASGRWTGACDVRSLLEQLADVADRRAAGADTPPYGLCHSEFHPTSLHTSPHGIKVLDWARAFAGPGLLDLASWEDTPKPLDVAAIAEMIAAYVAAGGAESAQAKRGGLSAAAWAGGWHRLWIIEWYLQQSVKWMPDPGRDQATRRAVRRHLLEALQCLRQ